MPVLVGMGCRGAWASGVAAGPLAEWLDAGERRCAPPALTTTRLRPSHSGEWKGRGHELGLAVAVQSTDTRGSTTGLRSVPGPAPQMGGKDCLIGVTCVRRVRELPMSFANPEAGSAPLTECPAAVSAESSPAQVID